MLLTANGKKWGNLDLNQRPAGYESVGHLQITQKLKSIKALTEDSTEKFRFKMQFHI